MASSSARIKVKISDLIKKLEQAKKERIAATTRSKAERKAYIVSTMQDHIKDLAAKADNAHKAAEQASQLENIARKKLTEIRQSPDPILMVDKQPWGGTTRNPMYRFFLELRVPNAGRYDSRGHTRVDFDPSHVSEDPPDTSYIDKQIELLKMSTEDEMHVTSKQLNEILDF